MRFLSLLRVARAGLITKLPEIDIHCNVSGWAGELRGTKDRRRGKWEGEIVLSEHTHGHSREFNFLLNANTLSSGNICILTTELHPKSFWFYNIND